MKLIFPVFKGSRGGPGCLYSQTRFTSGFLHRFRRPWVVAAGVIVKLIRRHAVKAGVRSFSVVEVEIDSNQSSGFCDCLIGLEIDLLIFHAAPERYKNTLPLQRPFPSILILMLSSLSFPVKASLVNWRPGSVLKISGLLSRAMASFSASRQKLLSMVLETPQQRAFLLYQSRITVRSANPLAMGR